MDESPLSVALSRILPSLLQRTRLPNPVCYRMTYPHGGCRPPNRYAESCQFIVLDKISTAPANGFDYFLEIGLLPVSKGGCRS